MLPVSTVLLFLALPLNAQLFDRIVNHFLVDGDVLATVQINNVLTSVANGLEFVAKLGKAPPLANVT